MGEEFIFGKISGFPMVSSLIDNDTKWWKVDMVRSIFLPFEANTILKIPMSYNLPEDSLIWIGNKKRFIYSQKCIPYCLKYGGLRRGWRLLIW